MHEIPEQLGIMKLKVWPYGNVLSSLPFVLHLCNMGGFIVDERVNGIGIKLRTQKSLIG